MIAKAKIYRDAQKLLRPMFQAFQANVTAYTVSLVAEKLGDRIDLDRIWAKQAASPELLACVCWHSGGQMKGSNGKPKYSDPALRAAVLYAVHKQDLDPNVDLIKLLPKGPLFNDYQCVLT